MESLASLQVMVLDCQTTGPNPDTGHLLEIGWAFTRADGRPEAAPSGMRRFWVRLPEGAGIPPRVRKITGISEDAMDGAVTPETAWRHLVADAEKVAGTWDTCPAVVHFARFENPFLRRLHRSAPASDRFPLQLHCTHRIACRLLPELPRLGLRALAGFFGHPVPEQRRCGSHVTATAVVWRNLVALLAKAGVHSLDDLARWLGATQGVRRRGRSFPMASSVRSGLPDRPGIYRMLRSNGDVLYVGKAASLKKRVASYFTKGRPHGEHILEMLTQAVRLETTPTDSALQAAIAETDAIKRLRPPYNIALRRRGRNPGFSSKDWMHHVPHPDGVHCVGPLPGVSALRPLGALLAALNGATSATADITGLYTELFDPDAVLHGPDLDGFEQGFDRFRRDHADLLAPPVPPGAILRLGARLWRKRLAREETETDPGQVEPSRDWTPERVARAVDATVRRCTGWIRRGRWFCVLSESRLVWDPKGGDNRLVVVFQRGRVHKASTIGNNQPPPTSQGPGMPMVRRLANFDLDTYDRMRVLTTELRRLTAEKRRVALYVGGGAVLDRDRLSRLLAWV